MSDNSQPQQVPQDDQSIEEQPENTIKLYGKYVPTWIVVLTVIILIGLVWYMWNHHKKQSVNLNSSTRATLDKVVESTANTANTANTASAGITLSTPNTDETRRQLNKLFNSF